LIFNFFFQFLIFLFVSIIRCNNSFRQSNFIINFIFFFLSYTRFPWFLFFAFLLFWNLFSFIRFHFLCILVSRLSKFFFLFLFFFFFLTISRSTGKESVNIYNIFEEAPFG
jgi:hypothetical protein